MTRNSCRALWMAAAIGACAALACAAEPVPLPQPALWDVIARSGDEAWEGFPGNGVVVWSRNARVARETLEAFDCCRRRIRGVLGADAAGSGSVVTLVDDASAWEAIVRQRGFRPDGLALHVNNEIYLRVENGDVRMERIAHEMVHSVLRDAAGRVPLWLDEGIAGYASAVVARECLAEVGVDFSRALPPVQGELMEWGALTRMKGYPEGAEEAQLFYRQSEELVAAIAERIGPTNLATYARDVGRKPGNWHKILVRKWGVTETEWDDVVAKVEARMRLAWRR